MTPLQIEYLVRYTHTGASTQLTAPGLLDLLLDAAGVDAEARGFSLESVLKEGRAWVLSRLLVEIRAPLPRLGESLHVTTWPAAADGAVQAARHFRVHDAAGQEVAQATSRWLLIDAVRRRPLRLPEEMIELGRQAPTLDLILPKWAAAPEPFPAGVTFPVLRRDLDLNGHATSTRYVEWLFEPLSDAQAQRLPVLIDLSLRAETHRGDVLTAEALEAAPGLVSHRLLRADDARPVATMVTQWDPHLSRAEEADFRAGETPL